MRVRVHAADKGGCGWYRLRFPARAAKANGLDVELRETIDTLRYTDGEGREHVHSIHPDEDPGDVVVLQRPLRRQMVELIDALQARGTAVVVDMDDDFHALPKGHPARALTAASRDPESNRLWLRKACERADLVTVSTPALAERYGSHGRCVVLPNCVPESYLTVGENARPLRSGHVTVGWTGSVDTHVGDLDVTGGGVAAALRANPSARFHVVGTGRGVHAGLQLDHPPTTTGWSAFEAYPYRYARLDVAVVPLADSRFNAAKSWLKGLEAAALGVPFVASPTVEYRRLADAEGAGYLARTPDAWQGWLSDLLTKPQMRLEAAAHGRTVASRWTYEARWGDWATAWTEALINAKTRRKVAA